MSQKVRRHETWVPNLGPARTQQYDKTYKNALLDNMPSELKSTGGKKVTWPCRVRGNDDISEQAHNLKVNHLADISPSDIWLKVPTEIRGILARFENDHELQILPWKRWYITSSDTDCIDGITMHDIRSLKGGPRWCLGLDPSQRIFFAAIVRDKHTEGVAIIFQRYSPLSTQSIDKQFNVEEKEALNNCWLLAFNGTQKNTCRVYLQNGWTCSKDSNQTMYLQSLLSLEIE